MRVYDKNEYIIEHGEIRESDGFMFETWKRFKKVFDRRNMELIISGEKLSEEEFENCIKFLFTPAACQEILEAECSEFEDVYYNDYSFVYDGFEY